MHDPGHGFVSEPKKTSTITLRIDDHVMRFLRDEAEHSGISLNSFINQALKRFVEWDVYESKVGMMPVAKPIVIELFNKMSKEETADMALNIGKNVVHDIALFMKNKLDLDSFLSWFETRMKCSSIETNHSVENDLHVYMLKHDLGENWSLYHKIVLELMFNEVFGKAIDITISKTTIRFKFKE
jgi:hypothetical protein